jgi:predicted Zn-dependent protease
MANPARQRTMVIGLVIGVAMLTGQAGVASEAPAFGVVQRTDHADISANRRPPAGEPSSVTQDRQTGPHVRTQDPQLAKVIRQGLDQSPTLRDLVHRIDGLPGFVYVVWSRCGTRLWEPDTCQDHRIGGSEGIRFLRVNIYPGASGERLLALIAHELQHALEVLSHDNVTSQKEVVTLYERIGIKRRAADNYETEAAGRVSGCGVSRGTRRPR